MVQGIFGQPQQVILEQKEKEIIHIRVDRNIVNSQWLGQEWNVWRHTTFSSIDYARSGATEHTSDCNLGAKALLFAAGTFASQCSFRHVGMGYVRSGLLIRSFHRTLWVTNARIATMNPVTILAVHQSTSTSIIAYRVNLNPSGQHSRGVAQLYYSVVNASAKY